MSPQLSAAHPDNMHEPGECLLLEGVSKGQRQCQEIDATPGLGVARAPLQTSAVKQGTMPIGISLGSQCWPGEGCCPGVARAGWVAPPQPPLGQWSSQLVLISDSYKQPTTQKQPGLCGGCISSVNPAGD